MSTKETILNKIHLLIANSFATPEEAFAFFDTNGDGKLERGEIIRLLKKAEISGFIRGFVATKLIEGYDVDGDDLISWEEFKAAIDEVNENV